MQVTATHQESSPAPRSGIWKWKRTGPAVTLCPLCGHVGVKLSFPSNSETQQKLLSAKILARVCGEPTDTDYVAILAMENPLGEWLFHVGLQCLSPNAAPRPSKLEKSARQKAKPPRKMVVSM